MQNSKGPELTKSIIEQIIEDKKMMPMADSNGILDRAALRSDSAQRMLYRTQEVHEALFGRQSREINELLEQKCEQGDNEYNPHNLEERIREMESFNLLTEVLLEAILTKLR